MTDLTGKLFVGVGGQYWLDKPKPGEPAYEFKGGMFVEIEKEVSSNDLQKVGNHRLRLPVANPADAGCHQGC